MYILLHLHVSLLHSYSYCTTNTTFYGLNPYLFAVHTLGAALFCPTTGPRLAKYRVPEGLGRVDAES